MEDEEISLEVLKSFFENYKDPLPKSLKLYKGTTILDVEKYIERTLILIEKQGHNPTYKTFMIDLIKLKNLLSSTNHPTHE